MKKILILILSAMLVFSISAAPMYAKTTAMTTEEKIKNLIDDGLSKEDAEYYAHVDDMVKSMEEKNIKVILDDSIPDMSDEEIAKDKKGFRKRILNGDKVALKKALKSTTARVRGISDLKKLIEKNRGQTKYVIEYPDGSKCGVNLNPGIRSNDKLVRPNEYCFWEYTQSTGYWYGGWAEWWYEDYTSRSKIIITVDYFVDTGVSGSIVSYAMGGQSSYGTISIANSNGGVISRQNGNYYVPAEACNQVVFTTSGAFGCDFGPLAVSVTAGGSWTQYVYYRVFGSGILNGVADSYE